MNIETRNSIIFLSLWFAGGILLYILYNSILYPSYLSTIHGCGLIDKDGLAERGMELVGSVSLEPTDEINITFYREEVDKTTIKHEWIHVKQIKQERISECDNLSGHYINEIEAYSFQNLPDFIYEKIYGIPSFGE